MSDVGKVLVVVANEVVAHKRAMLEVVDQAREAAEDAGGRLTGTCRFIDTTSDAATRLGVDLTDIRLLEFDMERA